MIIDKIYSIWLDHDHVSIQRAEKKKKEKIYIIIYIVDEIYLLWRKSMMINIEHMFLYSSHLNKSNRQINDVILIVYLKFG